MSKKIMLVSSILLTILLCSFIFYNIDDERVVIENKESSKIINTNALTMMYETDYQSGEYQVSSDTSWPVSGYTFNENLSKCENGSVLTWDDENKKVLMKSNTSDKCYVYFDKNPNTLAAYITSLYTTDGDNGLYYHDGVGSYTNADQEAGDNSYRYSGGNDIVDNYICFGSNETSCPTENLYRIIGVFNNKVKIIKATKIDENVYEYSSGTESCNNINTVANLSLTNKDIIAAPSRPTGEDGCNKWEQSDLNEILNITFYNSFSNDWKEKIENHNWNITGINLNVYPFPDISLKDLFNAEITNATDFYTAKIGLMYASDYVYGKSPSHWLDPVSSTSNYDNYAINESTNWLFQEENEWTITRDIFEYYYYYLINSLSYYIMNNPFWVDGMTSYSGSIVSTGVHSKGIIRPTFYLNSDVQYVSGTGTETDPYRIA